MVLENNLDNNSNNYKTFYIYKITNKINGKCYIGKSGDVKSRWADHKKVGVGGKDKYLQDFFALHAAINKYGVENFDIEILSDTIDEVLIYKLETMWIKHFKSNDTNFGYNCNLGGLGGIVPNDTVRAKLVAAQNKPEVSARKSQRMKKLHQENPGYLVKHLIGNQHTKGKHLSEEHKLKISIGLKNSAAYKDSVKNRDISKYARGTQRSRKFTDADIVDIRSKYSPKKYNMGQLSKEYNVGSETIRRIIFCKTWKHVPGTPPNKKETRSANCVLTEEKVLDIRQKYLDGNFTLKQLGELYGIGADHVGQILKYKIWKNCALVGPITLQKKIKSPKPPKPPKSPKLPKPPKFSNKILKPKIVASQKDYLPQNYIFVNLIPLKSKVKKIKNLKTKLTEIKVKEIREKYASKKYSFSTLAREYQIDSETIRDVVYLKTWKHVPGEMPNFKRGNQKDEFTKRKDAVTNKLTESLVLEIREKYSSQKYTMSSLAKEYNVDSETIRSVILFKRWKNVGGPTPDFDPRSLCIKLDVQKVKEIREKYNTGKYTRDQLATEYNISKDNVFLIVTYKTWKDV